MNLILKAKRLFSEKFDGGAKESRTCIVAVTAKMCAKFIVKEAEQSIDALFLSNEE